MALALLFAGADSVVRLREIDDVQGAFTGLPAVDPSSPTGYVDGQRGLIVSSEGLDGLHWIMQTQMMLAGSGARVHRVAYDDASAGREVHWSSSFRWWLAGLALVHHTITGSPIPIAVERVAPYANIVFFAMLIVLLAMVMAPRLGSVATAVLVLGMVAIKPFFVPFSVGNIDHHGLAVGACLLTVLFLCVGGAGWVRDEETPRESERSELAPPLPTFRQARGWFIASAVAGGVGLWISAATETPVLLGLGIGALFSTGWLGRRWRGGARWRPRPELWRTWGAVGAFTSVFLYLVEYFPSNLGWRLEVNHPLFALSWLGAGYILFFGCKRMIAPATVAPREWALVSLSVVALLALPTAIVLAPARTFLVGDPFLETLFARYIGELRPFATYWAAVSWESRLSDGNLLPLVCVGLGMLVWNRRWASPARAIVLLGWPAGVIGIALAAGQMRWTVEASGVWLAVLAATVTVLARDPGFGLTTVRGRVVAGSIALVLIPAPMLALRDWMDADWQRDATAQERLSLVERGVAQTMRKRLGSAPIVVLTAPASTSLLVYYGGMRGLGTLYWENLQGLEASTSIFAAPTDERAHELITQHGVTQIVLFSWDSFADESAALARVRDPHGIGPEGTFLSRMIATGKTPPWVKAYRYKLPDDEMLKGQWVEILEVQPRN